MVVIAADRGRRRSRPRVLDGLQALNVGEALERRHRDRGHGDRARPRELRVEHARPPLERPDDRWPDDQAPVGGRRGDRGDPHRGHGRPRGRATAGLPRALRRRARRQHLGDRTGQRRCERRHRARHAGSRNAISDCADHVRPDPAEQPVDRGAVVVSSRAPWRSWGSACPGAGPWRCSRSAASWRSASSACGTARWTRSARCSSPWSSRSIIAIPLGVPPARSDGFQRVLKPVLDAMQTMPAFVYLVPVMALFNVGRVPGIIAAVIYALPPCIRLTDLGIRQVPHETVEAARVLRRDLDAAAAQGAAAARRARRSCWASTRRS